ncbi:MAG: VOC family protein [Candidatus Eremiobacteraeota bacterium]|nr:VOC family protein [Candidatus Eremiobacteraeota bacterium]
MMSARVAVGVALKINKTPCTLIYCACNSASATSVADDIQRLFSHVDLRVRDGPRALKFYDALLAEFGFIRVTQAPFTEAEPTWRREHWEANDEFFGFIVDPEFTANQNRIAFHASSRDQVDRVTVVLRSANAQALDGPMDYCGYYATFFEDPDGNRLEVCFVTKHGGLASNARSY